MIIMKLRRCILFLIGIIGVFHVFTVRAQELNQHRALTSDWIEVSPNQLWIAFNPRSTNPLAIKLITPEEVKIDDTNTLIIKSGYKMTQFRPSGNFESVSLGSENSLYEVEATYKGDLEFLKENDISEIIINTLNGPFSYPVQNKMSKSIKTKNATLVNSIKRKNQPINAPLSISPAEIIKRNTYTIPDKTPQMFLIEFYRLRIGETTPSLEAKETVEVTLIQLENIINEWKSNTDGHYIYDCKITNNF